MKLFFVEVYLRGGSAYCNGGAAVVRANDIEHARELAEASGELEVAREWDPKTASYDNQPLCVYEIEPGNEPGVLHSVLVSE